jgi:hypothetical protein
MLRRLSAVAFWFGLAAAAAMAGPLHDLAKAGDEAALKVLLYAGAGIEEKKLNRRDGADSGKHRRSA